MKEANKATIRRVGAITCGISLILFGILFLLHMIFPVFNFSFIFRLWPCIFIMLGIEILIGNYKNSDAFIYDKGAIVILLLMMIFAMIMAWIQEWMAYLPATYAWR